MKRRRSLEVGGVTAQSASAGSERRGAAVLRHARTPIDDLSGTVDHLAQSNLAPFIFHGSGFCYIQFRQTNRQRQGTEEGAAEARKCTRRALPRGIEGASGEVERGGLPILKGTAGKAITNRYGAGSRTGAAGLFQSKGWAFVVSRTVRHEAMLWPALW